MPPASDAGWIGVEEGPRELQLLAARAGYSRTHEQLDALLRSRRHQVGDRIARFGRWLTSAF